MTASLALVVLAVLLWPAGPGRPTTARPAPGPRRTGSWTVGRSRRRHHRDWVADLAEVVVIGLEAGLDLPRAVLAAAAAPTVREDAPWLLTGLEQSVAVGEPVTRGLGALLAVDGVTGSVGPRVRADLGVLVRAWSLSEELGAPAAVTTAAAAAWLRARQADRDRALALTAGPRASMWLLTALPVLGPAFGLLLGVGPERLYAGGAARAGALTGLLFTAMGWAWAARLLRRARRPARTA